MIEQQFDLQSIIQEAVGQKIADQENRADELEAGISTLEGKLDTLEASIGALDAILSSNLELLVSGIIAQDAKTSEWCLEYLRLCVKAGLLDRKEARVMFALQHGNSPTMRERFEKVVGKTKESK